MRLAIVIAKRAAAEVLAKEAVIRLERARTEHGTAGGGIGYAVSEHLLRLAADELRLAEKNR